MTILVQDRRKSSDTNRSNEVPQSSEASLLVLLAEQSKRVPIPVSALLLVLGTIAGERIASIWPVLLWLVLVFSVMAVRIFLLARLPSITRWSVSKKLRIAIFLSGINGASHGLILFAFPLLSEPERAFFSVLVMGLCTGAVGTTVGHRPLFLAYLIPTMVPLAVFWALSPGSPNPSWVERSIAALLLLYIWILLGLAKWANSTFQESFRIRFHEHQLNAQLQVALAQARDASHAKTRFLAAASHDLRQPLQSLSMLIATLSIRKLDERSTHIVALLQQANASLSDLLDSLLDISKLDAGIVQPERQLISLQSLLTKHFERVKNTIEDRGLIATLEAPTHISVDTDPLLLSRIIQNLTDNAIKFTDTGEIKITLDTEGANARISVHDTGRGIPLEHQQEIFQEFYQLDNQERDRTKGLGLGLSIVQRLGELLGAEIRLKSHSGGGSTFTVLLPLVTQHLEHGPNESGAAPVSAFTLTVLIVDDERSVRTSLRLLLEEMGCHCIEAGSTAEAVQKSLTERPDLLLADFRLRGKDGGIATINAVKAIWPDIHAILVSGDTAPDRLQEANSAGIRLLHKPLQLETLSKELSCVKAQ